MLSSRTRKFVRLKPEQAYESILQLIGKNLDAENIKSEKEDNLVAKTKIGGRLAVSVKVFMIPQGDVSWFDFIFSYKSFVLNALIVLFTVIGLGLILQTWIPGIGIAIILPLAYKSYLTAREFILTINEAIPYLEREFNRKALMKDRKRWELEPKETKGLYERLRRKHIDT